MNRALAFWLRFDLETKCQANNQVNYVPYTRQIEEIVLMVLCVLTEKVDCLFKVLNSVFSNLIIQV